MINAGSEIQYSNVLTINTGAGTKQVFKMYPSQINDNAMVNISAIKNEQAALQVVDLNGRSVYQKNIPLQQGNNSVVVNGLGRLPRGTYVAVVNAGGVLQSQKIMIQ